MEKLLITIVFVGIVMVAGIWGLNSLTDSRATLEYERGRGQATLEYERGRSQAMVINAQGQSRLDSAQAAATIMTAAYPWLITMSIVALVLVIIVIAAIIFLQPANNAPQYIIERQQTVFVLQPGQSRKSLYMLLANDNQIDDIAEQVISFVANY